jgi:hypothetical protein
VSYHSEAAALIQEFFAANDDSDLISDHAMESIRANDKSTSDEYLQIVDYEDWTRTSQISFLRHNDEHRRTSSHDRSRPTSPTHDPAADAHPTASHHEEEIRPEDSASNLTGRLTLAQFRTIDARILQHCVEAGTFFLKYGPAHRLRLSDFVRTISALTSRHDLYNLMHGSRHYNSYLDSFKTEPWATRYGSEFYDGQASPDASTRYDEAITGPISRTAPNAHSFRQIVLKYLLSFLHSHSDIAVAQVVSGQTHTCLLSQVCPWNWYATIETPVSPAADPDIETWLANKAIAEVYRLELTTKYFSTYSFLSMSFRYLSTHQLFATALAASTSPPNP